MNNPAEPAADHVPVLSPETTSLVMAFARACRAAARAIALYPAEHPAVATTMTHVVETANQASSG